MSRALPGLLKALAGDGHVIIESNSLLAFLKPAVFLIVIDQSRPEVKASARNFSPTRMHLSSADPQPGPSAGGPPPAQLPNKAVFRVSAGDWSNPSSAAS